MFLSKPIAFALEVFYTTFVCCFYTYVAMTFIHFKPFSLGFHPPLEITQLSMGTLLIFLIIFTIKSIGLLADMLAGEKPVEQPVSYTYDHRRCR